MTNLNGWTTKSLGQIAELVMGQSPDSKHYSEEENGLPFLQGCAEFGARFPKHLVYCSQIKKVAVPNSILFSVRAPVGRLNIADQSYIIGRGLAAITGKKISQGYLEHYLLSEESKFWSASQGSTFEAINSSELRGWPIEYPLFNDEQDKIAEIIFTVDRAIEKTKALIAKQQRIMTGMMQDFLTCGIDEQGNLRSEETHKFKDSPLGRIPVEWDVVELSSFTSSADSITYGVLKPGPYDEYGIPLLQIEDVIHGDVDVADLHRISSKLDDQYKRTRLLGGEIVVSLVGTIGRIAHLSLSLRGANLHRNLGLVRIVEPNSSRFIFHYLQSECGQKEFANNALGSTQALFNLSSLRALRISRPSPPEQQLIAERIDSIHAAISETTVASLKLFGVKIGLMQDLLSGEKRVTSLLGPLATN